MSFELKRNRSSFIIDEKEENESKQEIDIILDLYTKVLKKEDSKCVCSNLIQDNMIYEAEIVPNLSFKTTNFKVKASDIIMKLKECGYPLWGCMLSVYNLEAEEFIFIGSDPLDQNIYLDESFGKSVIRVRVISYLEEKLINAAGANILNNSNNVAGSNISNKHDKSNSENDKKNLRRTKERKIGYIIEKVNTWRKLYNGFYDDYGNFMKYSLDEAAKIIDISKKSLDDYLLQLRLGRKYGFDFNANRNCKVGMLRAFVKQKRGERTK